jgi:hypothetical protein
VAAEMVELEHWKLQMELVEAQIQAAAVVVVDMPQTPHQDI